MMHWYEVVLPDTRERVIVAQSPAAWRAPVWFRVRATPDGFVVESQSHGGPWMRRDGGVYETASAAQESVEAVKR